MALLEKHLVVKRSQIPGSGKGLYTKVDIPKGTKVVEYKGRITKWKELKDSWDNGYIYSVNRNHVIDAKRTLSALARYANDAKGISRIKGLNNNCTYVNYGLRAYIESVKNIPAGSEILVDYGKEYWDVMRENRKIDREKTKKSKKSKRPKRSKKTKRSKKS
jgi:SET domain-containing protein